MDAFQQSHRFMRPPPPPSSMADPHLNLPHHHAPPRQPVPSQGPWYPGQFQYHPSQPPSPPPQWAAPPHSDHLPPSAYPAPALHNPYPAYPPHSQFPPPPRASVPPPHLPPPHHPHSQVPPPYPQVNQEWGNSNWAHHQSWEYPAHSNEEDWAARARAWAAAKAAMENQHPQSQFTPGGRHDEQSHYHDHFPQPVDPHYPEFQQQSFPASSYQHYPLPPAPPHRPVVAHLQESTSIAPGSSYVPDGHLPYTVRDGTLAGESSALFPRQESLPTSPSVHQQEVPSSYSSVAGKEEAADQKEQMYKSLPYPVSSDQEPQHNLQPSLSAGRSVLMEQPHFSYGNQSVDATTDLVDQPLVFASRFNREHDPLTQSSYTDPAGTIRGTDPIAAVPSIHNWTPTVASGVVYPPIPRHDPSIAVPSSLSGHPAPMFGRIPGATLQPPVPSVGTTFGLSAGNILHPTTTFSGDAFGVSNVPERPKKASVPNWLREEIIKKKAVISSSAPEHLKEEAQSIEDEGIDKSLGKGDQAESKSIDSSRSTEEEDDDEDYVEAARTAAINQEIKRVLTEVLLKVTDELFDEIATKVLNEDDLTIEVEANAVAQNHKVSPSPASTQNLKASAKVLIPVKAKETVTEDVGGKSSSSSPGDVLGLASYASDEDDDDVVQTSSLPDSGKNAIQPQSNVKNFSDTVHDAVENGSLQANIEELGRGRVIARSDPGSVGTAGVKIDRAAEVNESSDNGVDRQLERGNIGPLNSSKDLSEIGKYDTNVVEKKLDGSDDSQSKLTLGDSHGREAKIKPAKDDRHEIKSSVGKGVVRELESDKKVNEKVAENHQRQDERRFRMEKTDERNGSKERMKEQHLEKTKESDSRKKSYHLDAKEDRKETERAKKVSDKVDINRKRERGKDEKGDRSRHRPVTESSKHKRRRSSSPSSRGRNSKDNSLVSHANDSSDDASENSKRKLHSKRRNSSPSPGRSRRRQVSRSPHSKHSERRHSPYSSLEASRGRRSRSRSRSPVRRKRSCEVFCWSDDPRRLGGGGASGIRVHFTLPNFNSTFPLKLHTPSDRPNLQKYFKPISASILASFLNYIAPMKVSSSFSSFARRKPVQLGLWSIWTCGFLLIGLSLYATQRLPSLEDQINNSKGLDHLGDPTIAIFSAPRPFTGSIGARQVLAVRSWLALSPDISIFLFSRDPSVASFARAFGSRVSIEPNIDFTFLGTPFFHSMVARAQASTSDISVLIDPETILLPDLISTLNHACKLDHEWLLVASSQNISYFPFYLDETGKHWLREGGRQIGLEKLQEFLAQTWQWSYCDERMLMAWNNRGLLLHSGVIPPFLYGRGLHNHWVINEALSFDSRFVFDASWTISNFRLNNSDQHSNRLVGGFKVPNIEEGSWETLGNSHLGALYGSLYFHEAKYSDLVKLIKCSGQYIFVDTEKKVIHPFGYESSLSLWNGRIFHFWREKKTMECIGGIKSAEKIIDCSMKNLLASSMRLHIPFSLESLLSAVADKNKTVVLAVAGYSYKDMLMSWACRMRQLLVMNFVVCALDHEIYQFSILQGLPVFKDPLAPSNISFSNCHFGTKCFQRVTKVKSRLVLQILKLGYNVLLSDVDVYWFQNPLPFLYSFGPAVVAAQSDEYKKTGPINLPRRLNSGFYFARSDGKTIAAMEMIVKHAATSNLSEQPSFYDTLCGKGGTNRLGDDRCLEPKTNLTVYFLDRNLFPNGAYDGLWEKKDVKTACLKKGCLILHNNWISGRSKKLERQVLSGLWEYDLSTRMCLQSWHNTKVISYF
ncbi:uncharacterized protein LOC131144024 [Malania oleifera]|uniref:uncharacterized protein LOC131144024 n=1 Tax=Malania oleifera TaxID=397392 RepID=UPI0025ADA35E|nr:uncharacterized protein LOC131144024 [Malania oleifera]